VLVLGQQAAIQLAALLPTHARHVKRVSSRLLVGRLLQLPAVDQLHVTDRRSSSFGRFPARNAGSQRG
jgi:hypothetical protein